MNLNDALLKLAAAGNLNADELIAYAAEDTIGGWHLDESQRKWPTGSMWGVEGQLIYALVRAMRPALVCELGVSHGCSATHILSALEANGKGKLISVDIYESSGNGIPDNLKHRWQFKAGTAVERIPTKAEIVLEDLDHYEGTLSAFRVISALKPRLVLAHDAEHHLVGSEVRKHFQYTFGTCDTVLIEPGNCGFAYKFFEKDTA